MEKVPVPFLSLSFMIIAGPSALLSVWLVPSSCFKYDHKNAPSGSQGAAVFIYSSMRTKGWIESYDTLLNVSDQHRQAAKMLSNFLHLPPAPTVMPGLGLNSAILLVK